MYALFQQLDKDAKRHFIQASIQQRGNLMQYFESLGRQIRVAADSDCASELPSRSRGGCRPGARHTGAAAHPGGFPQLENILRHLKKAEARICSAPFQPARCVTNHVSKLPRLSLSKTALVPWALARRATRRDVGETIQGQCVSGFIRQGRATRRQEYPPDSDGKSRALTRPVLERDRLPRRMRLRRSERRQISSLGESPPCVQPDSGHRPRWPP